MEITTTQTTDDSSIFVILKNIIKKEQENFNENEFFFLSLLENIENLEIHLHQYNVGKELNTKNFINLFTEEYLITFYFILRNESRNSERIRLFWTFSRLITFLNLLVINSDENSSKKFLELNFKDNFPTLYGAYKTYSSSINLRAYKATKDALKRNNLKISDYYKVSDIDINKIFQEFHIGKKLDKGYQLFGKTQFNLYFGKTKVIGFEWDPTYSDAFEIERYELIIFSIYIDINSGEASELISILNKILAPISNIQGLSCKFTDIHKGSLISHLRVYASSPQAMKDLKSLLRIFGEVIIKIITLSKVSVVQILKDYSEKEKLDLENQKLKLEIEKSQLEIDKEKSISIEKSKLEFRRLELEKLKLQNEHLKILRNTKKNIKPKLLVDNAAIMSSGVFSADKLTIEINENYVLTKYNNDISVNDINDCL